LAVKADDSSIVSGRFNRAIPGQVSVRSTIPISSSAAFRTVGGKRQMNFCLSGKGQWGKYQLRAKQAYTFESPWKCLYKLPLVLDFRGP